MKKLLKRAAAVFMALTVVAGMSAVSFAATSERPVATWDRSKSKVASELNGNFESTITLSLPAAEESLESDVVFVVDNSSCKAASKSSWAELIRNLETVAINNGAKVNVGVVNFKGTAESTGLISLGGESTAEEMIEDVEERSAALDRKASADNYYKGSNVHAGLLEANKMLAEDTDVANDRKYVIVLSDGITYTWMNDGGTQVGVPYKVNDSGQINLYYPSNSSYDVFKGSLDFHPENDDWGTYLASEKSAIDNTLASDYVQRYSRKVADFTSFLAKDEAEAKPYADTVDVALAKSLEAYNALLDAGYKCYAVHVGSYVQYGKSFMKYLTSISTNPTVDFNEIQNDILYHLGSGSKITDVIGYGTDSTGAEYDFQFINDIDRLVMREGQTELDKTAIDDNTYGFGKTEDGYKYVIHYYANGVDGQSGECYVWDINTSVSSFSSTSFEYVVKLTNPQTQPGKYEELMTNFSASLSPVSSNGLVYADEYFEKPTVFYTVQKTPGGDDDEKDKIVDTSDHMNVAMYTLIAFAATMALAITLILRKKFN